MSVLFRANVRNNKGTKIIYITENINYIVRIPLEQINWKRETFLMRERTGILVASTELIWRQHGLWTDRNHTDRRDEW